MRYSAKGKVLIHSMHYSDTLFNLPSDFNITNMNNDNLQVS